MASSNDITSQSQEHVYVKDLENGNEELELSSNNGVSIIDELNAAPKHCLLGCTRKDMESEQMIACDSGFCEIEWFHIECMGLSVMDIPKDKWCCPTCEEKTKLAVKAKKRIPGRRKLPQLGLPEIDSTADSADRNIIREMEERRKQIELQIAQQKLEKAERELASLKLDAVTAPRPSVPQRVKETPSVDEGAAEGLKVLLRQLGLQDLVPTSQGKPARDNKSGLHKQAQDDRGNCEANWPHMQLRMEYGVRAPKFVDMNLSLFVAGELECVELAKDDRERSERIKLLKELMYQSGTYETRTILNAYAAWLRDIERGAVSWGDDYGRVIDPIFRRAPPRDRRGGRMREAGSDRPAEKSAVFFCAPYQKGKCKLESGHKGEIKGYVKEVKHICAACYIKDKVEAKHPECSAACPHYNDA